MIFACGFHISRYERTMGSHRPSLRSPGFAFGFGFGFGCGVPIGLAFS